MPSRTHNDATIQVSRKKLYELINQGELESYIEGKSRPITVKSINEYIERRSGPPWTRCIR